ncbi:MAG: pseudouridine-5'-phosphate glycosidase [Candidatus Izemoplasmatales bacterium]|nr:pseudouridine-5'-phosphate glycosidase [Candidatus Izemoplasmatales bacterium]NLF48210.1 pseudouridine-5'-phosphate glycosidase [Acholeplasmataceae bacterium]
MIRIHPDIKKALKYRQPIVALESTIIAHGMPYPQNVETALNCERIIRENGAIPATMAILSGEITVGLTISEIESIGLHGKEVRKISRRDFADVIYRKETGALTVAGTLMVCAMTGIRFFATGGIGGVHRNFSEIMDVSADLDELAESNVCLVSAGAKAILDIPKTLEYLETKGVSVIGYQTNLFPQFYTRESSLPVDFRLDNPEAVAQYLKTKDQLEINGGVLIANPIPEIYSIPNELIDDAINKAVKEAEQTGVSGSEVTPFLLKRVSELTDGRSLEANRRLVYNNCELAAKIALESSKLEAKR